MICWILVTMGSLGRFSCCSPVCLPLGLPRDFGDDAGVPILIKKDDMPPWVMLGVNGASGARSLYDCKYFPHELFLLQHHHELNIAENKPA